jgi:multidrug efflux pump subunit AcrB
VRTLRRQLPGQFTGTTFYFLPSDIVTQILNFGLPSPIDVQVDGADVDGDRVVLNKMLGELKQVPGLVDLRVQQPDDYPVLDLSVDRTKAQQGGYTERDVGSSVLNVLGGSTQLSPQFYLDPTNGVTYNIVAQTPQYLITSLSDLENIPISSVSAKPPEIVADVANISRSAEMEVVSHYNIRRTLDIYGSVQDRDLGAVAKEIDKIVQANTLALPRGSFSHVRGQIETMRTSYIGLLSGLGFAIILVYLLIVVNFQSWLDPFIIITALPAALAGIVLFLFITHTTLSVPALNGSDHVHGRGHRQQHPSSLVRQGKIRRTRRRRHRSVRIRRDPLPPRYDDRLGDDHRHDPDGAWRRRRWRRKRTARTRRNRRIVRGHRCDSHFCSRGLWAAASPPHRHTQDRTAA